MLTSISLGTPPGPEGSNGTMLLYCVGIAAFIFQSLTSVAPYIDIENPLL